MFMISRMFTVGAGVTQDYVEAHAWMNLSASNDKLTPEYSADLREALARKMTASQVAKAQVRAKTLIKELGLK